MLSLEGSRAYSLACTVTLHGGLRIKYIKNLSVETDPNAPIQVQWICNTGLVVKLGSGFGFSITWIEIGIWIYNTIWIKIWI
jgi:hypothetical protein